MRARPATLLLVPPFALFAGLFVYPVARLIASGLSVPTALPVWSDPFFRHVLVFTYAQGLLSACTSLVVGTAGALLWSEGTFRGRALLGRLSLVCFALPPVLVTLGFLGLWGRQGIVNRAAHAMGSSPVVEDPYGWAAIVAVNTFFNFPLFLKSVGTALRELDRDLERAALSLGASRWSCFFRVTLPRVLPELRSAFVLAFLYSSSSSFLVVLMLGGSPRFTTLEVAIYQALKVDFDPALAARLALVQMAVALVLYVACARSRGGSGHGAAGAAFLPIYRARGAGTDRALRAAYFALLAVLAAGPILSLVLSGVAGLRLVDWHELAAPALTSLRLAFLVALFTVPLALGLAYSERHAPARWRAAIGWLAGAPLSVSAICLTLALVTAFPGLHATWRGSLLPVAIVQSLVALPLVYRPLRDGLFRIPDSLHAAAASLGASPLRAFGLVEVPLAARAIGVACLFAVASSLGEIGAVMLFLTEEIATLPLWIFRLMSRYRFDEAYAVGLLLLVVMVAIFWLAREAEA